MKSLLSAVCLSAVLATSAIAQTAEPDVATLVDDVTSIASTLQTRITTLGEQMAASSDAESGTRALDEMLSAARELDASLGRDSPLWDEMNTMLDAWNERRDDLLERAADNAALRPIALGWQERIDDGMTLREQILVQAAESQALIDQIEAEREVVIEYYNLGLADQALQTMQAMSDDLGVMNESMSQILAQANVVAQTPEVDN